jgi:predicted transport protein
MPATPSRKKSASPAPQKAARKVAKPALKAVKAAPKPPKSAPKPQGMGPRNHMEAMKANLPEKTGKTFEQWVEVARQGPPEVKALVAWLKKEGGLGTVVATMVAHHVHGGYMKEHEDPAALLEGNFAGEKASLRPVYEALVKAAKKLGEDFSLYPCKTYITLKRSRQIGVVKVAKDRIDLGLILPGVEAAGRLEKATRSIGNDRVTHKVALASKKDVDAEALEYLKQAYALDGRAEG